MGRQYKGRNYLVTAIRLLVVGSNDSESVLNQTADEYEVAHSSVTRAMQTVIENTWYDCDPDDLANHYTQYVSQKKGCPSHMEFIHFYADKISKTLTST